MEPDVLKKCKACSPSELCSECTRALEVLGRQCKPPRRHSSSTEKLVAFAEEILNAREPPKNDVACALESLRRASAAGFIAACVYRAKVSFAERLGDQINKDSVVVDLFAVVDRALELGVASPGPLLQNLALAEEAVFYSYYVFKETPIGEAIGRPFIPQRLDALERIISVAMKYAQVPEPRSARVAKEARITKEARIIISRAVSTVYEITRFIVSNPGSPLETKYTAQWIFDVLQSAIDAGCNDESIKGGMTTADAMLHQGEMLLEGIDGAAPDPRRAAKTLHRAAELAGLLPPFMRIPDWERGAVGQDQS